MRETRRQRHGAPRCPLHLTDRFIDARIAIDSLSQIAQMPLVAVMPREMSVAAGLIERLATVVVIVLGAVLLTALLLLLLPLRADGPLRLAADAGPRDALPRGDGAFVHPCLSAGAAM